MTEHVYFTIALKLLKWNCSDIVGYCYNTSLFLMCCYGNYMPSSSVEGIN